MTELRDARLRQALDEAPDAHLRPGAGTRAAVREAAHAATQPLWRRWWRGAGRQGTPWAAAFATVAVATLVIVTWEGREVPGARDAAPDTVAVAPAPQEVQRSPVVPTPPPAQAPAPAPAPALPPAAVARPGLSPPAEAPVLRAAPARQDAARDPAFAARQQARQQAMGEREAAKAARQAAPAMPRPMAPPATSMAPAPSPPAARAAAAPTTPATWNQVRVEANGKSVILPADEAGLLPMLVVRLLASPAVPVDAATGERPSLRLELAQGNDPVGVLDRLETHWRWTPQQPGVPARLLRPNEALAADLEEEAGRLLR